MWKLLRNLVLAAIFVAGALKLLAWYAVREDSQRVVAELAPYAQLKYAGISAGLNGSVALDDVAVTTAASHQVYRAKRATFMTPGLHWLLRHALLHENSVPQQFGIVVDGLQLPPGTRWLDRHVFDPQTFVPFPSLGCGTRDLSAVDYRKMGFDLRASSERLDYRYNDDTGTLNATLTLTAPNFTRIVLEAEVGRFDPTQALTHGWLEKLRFNQLSADYTDLGYLRARKRFCARLDGVAESQFVDRHISAVRELLLQNGITPSDSLTRLYRSLISEGGQVSVLSLPSKDFIPDSWRILGGNEVWRQLNVTSRYKDSPPIMFGLAFSTPENAVVSTPDASAAVTGDATSPAPTPAPEPTKMPQPAPAVAATPVVAKPSPGPSVPKPTPTTTISPTTKITAATIREPMTPLPKPQPDSLGLGGLDQAEAKLAAMTIKPVVAKPEALPSPVLPSSPPPPPDSTLALVWKPVIDELPESKPPPPDYVVIDISRLSREQGRRVRLITNGDIKVEGYVVGIDETSVRLRVNRGGGEALFSIPRSRIEQVQLLKR